MECYERVAAQGQAALGPERGRERVGPVGRVRERRLDELPQLRGRDLFAGRIDGREVGGRAAAVQVVGANLEAVSVRRAAQPDVRPRLELLLEPGLVEPGGGDLAAAVCDLSRQDLEPAASAPQRRPHDVALDHDLFVAAEGEQLGDAPLGGGVLVPPRPVVEQLADALEAELREPPAQRRADARQGLEWRLEPLEPEAPARGRPGGGRVQGRKTGGKPAHSPSMANGPARAAKVPLCGRDLRRTSTSYNL